MDRDGTRDGYDLDLIRTIADSVSVPVIASGGVGGLDDLVAGIRDGHASAVLAASIFHFCAEFGRAHVCTPLSTPHLLFRLLLSYLFFFLLFFFFFSFLLFFFFFSSSFFFFFFFFF